MMKSILSFFLLVILFTSCYESSQLSSKFSHDLKSGPTPWTHENFDTNHEQFTFAIITDLNGGERPGIFQVAVDQLNLLRPEFILSVGDLIDGGTEDRDQLNKEWESFDSRASEAQAPFFHLGGNHDLTNVVMRDVWSERYGPRYYHFIYQDVLFLMMDSEDYQEGRMKEIYEARADAIKVLDGSEPEKAQEMLYFQMPERQTGEIGDEQSRYFEEVLARYPNVRWTFVLMHKPVWKREQPGGLERVETALGDRHYTVINGHFHTYSHTERNGRDYIMLGTTGGNQPANTEMAFDHVTLVTMTESGPSLVNLKMEGILDKRAKVPGRTEDMCFQATNCKD